MLADCFPSLFAVNSSQFAVAISFHIFIGDTIVIHFVIAVVLLVGQPAEGTREVVVEDAQLKLISQVRIPAEEAGVLASIDVSEGDLVQRGQEIGFIDDRQALVEAEIAKLEHAIAKIQSENDVDERYARKSLDVSQSELKRSQEANKIYQDSVSQTEIERLRLVTDKSALAIEQSQRDREVAEITESLKRRTIELAALRQANRRIDAPMDGMLVEVFAHPGEWLNPGDPIARIIKMDRLRVEAHLDGKQFGRELNGCTVNLVVTLPPGDRMELFPGKVVFVSPELQPVTGEVRIWAEVENRDMLLRPGDHGALKIYISNLVKEAKLTDTP